MLDHIPNSQKRKHNRAIVNSIQSDRDERRTVKFHIENPHE